LLLPPRHTFMASLTKRALVGSRIVVVQGTGHFAQAVADGAMARARRRGLQACAVDLEAVGTETLESAAVLVAGDFEHDVATIRRLGGRERSLALMGAVAAGISAFEEELGEAAEGVLGPVQWWPVARVPEIGPSGMEFAAVSAADGP